MIERSFRMRRAVAMAWTALMWERLARVWWPAALFPALFALAAVFGLWRAVGDPWRALALLSALGLAGYFIVRGLKAGPWPGRVAATRRVEEDSGFVGRPFEALNDKPVISDLAGSALWKAHQKRMREAAQQAKARRPKAALAAADPMAIRGMLLLTAVAAGIVAGPAALERLSDAFHPGLIKGGARSADFQAWINPPDYTGRAPIFLDARTRNREIEAPEGSVFVARAAGVGAAPRLRIQTGGDIARVGFEDAGPGAFEARVTLERDATLSIASSTSASWDVTVLPDRPPAVALVKQPEPDPRQHLELAYEVDDDYGAEAAVLQITLLDAAGPETHEEALPIPRGRDKDESVTLDLTTHPWSGMEVELQIVARDGLGQEGRSLPVRMTLPERVFVDPLARALVHERRILVQSEEPYAPLPERPEQNAEDASLAPPVQPDELDRRIERAPEEIARVRKSLELMQEGADHFEEDYAVHLALSYLSERLRRGRSREEIADVPDVMWDAALRAEGGDLADAERALREARRALADALARGAPEQEIAELMENFQSAVQRYMDALMAEAIINGNMADPFAGGGDNMGEDALQEMLRALEELAETGSTDDARRLLQALSEMLLNMQMQLSMGSGGGATQQPPSPELQELLDQMEELADLIGQQRELMDQTQRESSRAGEDSQDGQQGGQQSGEQGQPQPGQSGSSSGGGQEQPFSDEGGAGAPDLAQNTQPGSRAGAGELSDELADALSERQRELSEQLQALAQSLAGGEGEEEGGGDTGGGPASAGEGEAGLRLEEAEEAMSRAERALRDGDGDEALRGQGEALDRLRAAIDSLADAEQAMEASQGGGDQAGEVRQPDTQPRDPFGRRSGAGGLGVGDDIDVPDEAERRRAREILDELRRRLEETGRSQEELDYWMRLLDRF